MDTPYCRVVERPLDEVPVPAYTEVEHGTWQLLLEKALSLLEGRACEPFIEGTRLINFPPRRIPRLRDVSEVLRRETGWSLVRVDGLVHPQDFFKLLSRRVFPSTDFIRKREDLDYTPAPDMFHDLFGHTPLLTNPDFTEFFEDYGRIAAAAAAQYPENDPVHAELQRIYWFTVEFGLINTPQGLRAYGSGSCSSPEELQHCVSDACRKHPFDLAVITKQEFDIWHLQYDVFVIDSFQQLGREFRAWARARGIEATGLRR